MRISRLFKSSMLLGVLLSGRQSLAREVMLLDFGAPSAVDANGGSFGGLPQASVDANLDEKPLTGPRPTALGVSDSMLLEFARPSKPTEMSAFPFAVGPLPTDGLRIPAWMTPRRSILHLPLGSAATFASGLLGGRYDRCDAMPYAPARWLDARTEVRRASYFATIAAVACEHGVPTALLDAVVAQESGYKNWAISPKGAMGMMQIMPGTASQLGLTTPFDPTANLRAGARYLRMQLDRFGRVDLALAAYNAGPHRRSLKEGRLPPIAETLNYVQTIMFNWGRLAPRAIEIASVDRGAIAAAAVAASPLRTATLVHYDLLTDGWSF